MGGLKHILKVNITTETPEENSQRIRIVSTLDARLTRNAHCPILPLVYASCLKRRSFRRHTRSVPGRSTLVITGPYTWAYHAGTPEPFN